jgi:hypothetical protein
MNNAATDIATLRRLAARKLAHTLFEGVDSAQWVEAAEAVADGLGAEELVYNAVDARGLFARDALVTELVQWLEEDAAQLQEEEN